MTAKNGEPLTGQAAYEAQKREIAKRNEKAFARGRERREAELVAARDRQRRLDERDLAQVPAQPLQD
jgi:hypothetical protein